MLEYDRIVNKTNFTRQCNICHYWNFLDKKFSYGPCLCDGFYNIMQKYIKNYYCLC